MYSTFQLACKSLDFLGDEWVDALHEAIATVTSPQIRQFLPIRFFSVKLATQMVCFFSSGDPCMMIFTT